MNKCELKKADQVLIHNCWIADTFIPRFLGLMGRNHISPDEGILFPKCNSIHTFFMRFPIDVVFLDENNSVVETIESLGAWRMLLPRRNTKHILELGANRIKELNIVVGDTLNCGGGKF
jgi:uncharacterized protein